MNEYAYVAFVPIQLQMFCHIHCMDMHEHLCDDFECAFVSLMRQWIPAMKWCLEIRLLFNNVIIFTFQNVNQNGPSFVFNEIKMKSYLNDRNHLRCIYMYKSSNRSIFIVKGDNNQQVFCYEYWIWSIFNAWWNNHSEIKIVPSFAVHIVKFAQLRSSVSITATNWPITLQFISTLISHGTHQTFRLMSILYWIIGFGMKKKSMVFACAFLKPQWNFPIGFSMKTKVRVARHRNYNRPHNTRRSNFLIMNWPEWVSQFSI